MFYIGVYQGMTGYFSNQKPAEAWDHQEVKFQFKPWLAFTYSSLHYQNYSPLSLRLCQNIVNLVECLRELEERKAKHDKWWLLVAMVNA